MDETIGVKGGANDRRRSMRITMAQKKKLEEYEEEREIAELEKKVKRKQFYTLIKTLPIVIGGGTIQMLHDTAKERQRGFTEEENSKWRIKEYDQDVSQYTPQEFEEQKRRKIIVTPTGEKVVVFVSAPTDEKKVEDVEPVLDEDKEKEPPKTSPTIIQEIVSPEPNQSEKKQTDEKTNEGPDNKKPSVGIGHEQIDIEDFIDKELAVVDFSGLSLESQEKLGKLKSRKIIDEYEKQLKEIRYELRKVIFEYNVLVEENDEAVLSREVEIILDRLSDVIDKIEELKRKIKVDDLDKYDDNYIYTLIEGYLEEFRDKNVVTEIEDSPLYIMLSEKLEELDQKKGKFSDTVEKKKDKLEEKEIDFDKLKKKFNSLEHINDRLIAYQKEQNEFLLEIQDKIKNAVTESEKVRTEYVGMNRQSRRLLRFLALQMFIPGFRNAKSVAAGAAAYMYFMNQIMKPEIKKQRYKVITVQDYHDEILDSISSLEDTIRLLGKTSAQIDRMMEEVKTKYRDYLGVVPECDELLSNLRKIKRDVEEKEYEMKRLKKEQELVLEKNDAKVKKMGEYPVN